MLHSTRLINLAKTVCLMLLGGIIGYAAHSKITPRSNELQNNAVTTQLKANKQDSDVRDKFVLCTADELNSRGLLNFETITRLFGPPLGIHVPEVGKERIALWHRYDYSMDLVFEYDYHRRAFVGKSAAYH